MCNEIEKIIRGTGLMSIGRIGGEILGADQILEERGLAPKILVILLF